MEMTRHEILLASAIIAALLSGAIVQHYRHAIGSGSDAQPGLPTGHAIARPTPAANRAYKNMHFSVDPFESPDRLPTPLEKRVKKSAVKRVNDPLGSGF